MAGPAIRAWEIARALSVEHDVTLATYGPDCLLDHGLFRTTSVVDRDLREFETWCDVLVFQGTVLERFPWLRGSSKVLVADVYDPFHLEVLEQLRDRAAGLRARAADYGRRALNTQLRRGDFFLCASPKQRDFWLGQLAGLGRINTQTYDADSLLTSLIDIAPFGTPEQRPVTTKNVLRDAVPGIGLSDEARLTARAAVDRVAPSLTWSKALDPLLAFCRSPSRAPDLVDRPWMSRGSEAVLAAGNRLRGEVEKVPSLLAEGGFGLLARKVVARVR